MFPLEGIKLPPVKEDGLNGIPPAGVKIAKPAGDHAAIPKSGRWKAAVQAYLATASLNANAETMMADRGRL